MELSDVELAETKQNQDFEVLNTIFLQKFREQQSLGEDTEEITNEIINFNMGLIHDVAQRIESSHSIGNLKTGDLINVGMNALYKAINFYDPQKAKFSTFATTVIHNDMNMEVLNNLNSIRIPVYIQQILFLLNREMQEQHIEPDDCIGIQSLLKNTLKVPNPQNILNAKKLVENFPISLENADDAITRTGTNNPEEIYIQKEFMNFTMSDLIEGLDEIDLYILTMSFGLNNEEPLRTKDLVKELSKQGISRYMYKNRLTKIFNTMRIRLIKINYENDPEFSNIFESDLTDTEILVYAMTNGLFGFKKYAINDITSILVINDEKVVENILIKANAKVNNIPEE